MDTETPFRAVFAASAIVLFAIRGYYQAKVRRDTGRFLTQQSEAGLLFGSVAAVVSIVFGLAYILVPGRPSWAYALGYPWWLRWLGVVLLTGGELLLLLAHHHLAQNFSSFVRVREGHTLVQSGPYRWIRHPIYTAYFMSYVGGGLVSGNWLLTFVPILSYAAMIALRLGKEEQAMIDEFGSQYEQYMRRTGRLLPLWHPRAPSDDEPA